MPRYLASLRGVSPMNAKMPEIKRCFEAAGFSAVKTVLSSGNVAFDARAASETALERRIEAAMAEHLDRSFQTLPSVAAAVQVSGFSHHHFITQFRHAVGLAPKTWLRVRRFQRTLQALRHDKNRALATLAAAAGYSDQAHFNRDFLAFTGVTPLAYLRAAPREANHLPMDLRRTGDKVKFLQYRDGRADEDGRSTIVEGVLP